jgi:hypothetical protein
MIELIFEKLKYKLYTVLILAFSDFKKDFIFYVDESKKKDYNVAVHQLNDFVPFKKRSVLYLLKILSFIKRRY